MLLGYYNHIIFITDHKCLKKYNLKNYNNWPQVPLNGSISFVSLWLCRLKFSNWFRFGYLLFVFELRSPFLEFSRAAKGYSEQLLHNVLPSRYYNIVSILRSHVQSYLSAISSCPQPCIAWWFALFCTCLKFFSLFNLCRTLSLQAGLFLKILKESIKKAVIL